VEQVKQKLAPTYLDAANQAQVFQQVRLKNAESNARSSASMKNIRFSGKLCAASPPSMSFLLRNQEFG